MAGNGIIVCGEQHDRTCFAFDPSLTGEQRRAVSKEAGALGIVGVLEDVETPQNLACTTISFDDPGMEVRGRAIEVSLSFSASLGMRYDVRDGIVHMAPGYDSTPLNPRPGYL